MRARVYRPGGVTAIIYLYTHEYAIFVYCVIILSYVHNIIIDMFMQIKIYIIYIAVRIGRKPQPKYL